MQRIGVYGAGLFFLLLVGFTAANAAASVTPMLSGSSYHSVALNSDGTVWGWGWNAYGQLGDGTTTQRLIPVQARGLGDIVAIASGLYHTVALKNDGTVWTWGGNQKGQLGDGTTANRLTPVQVSGLSGITAIAASELHTLAVKSDGTVWGWGSNYWGQLGDGTTTNRSTPVQVSGLSGITAIATGAYHTVALHSDGSVWAWGDNGWGQLGSSSFSRRLTPVQVSGLSGIAAIASGTHNTLALDNNGSVWTWGYNMYGQLGDGSTTDRPTPMKINGLSSIAAIAAGSYHALALHSDGTAWTWGYNEYGQLGDGDTSPRFTPVQVGGLSDLIAIAGGQYHTLALQNDGTVWSWGYNEFGQLGNGSISQRLTPVQVSDLSGSIAVAAGDNYSVALQDDGTAWGWGHNGYGQLGDGSATQRLIAVPVSGLEVVTSIAAGPGFHTVALRNDGSAWAWGENRNGQLGDGSTTQRLLPVSVSGLSDITMIAAGYWHTVALRSDGTVWTWGYNRYGQLGDGSSTQRLTPTQVYGLSDNIAIAAGGFFTAALRRDGTVWVWGANSSGQLGDGSYTQRLSPVQVYGLSGITKIAAGSSHMLALKNDGTVWAWGENGSGQLGDGTSTNRARPVRISDLSDITATSASYGHTVALRSDGTVWAWGSNSNGQLGDGSTMQSLVPVKVSGLSDATAIAAGSNHTLAVKNDGTAWAWGYNRHGQLGDTNYSIPRKSVINLIHGLTISTPKITVTDSIASTTDRQLPFGQYATGSSVAQTVTISNSGTAALVIDTVAASDPLAPPFGMSDDTCSGQSIAPADSCTLTVTFAPQAAGSYSDIFDIISNDPNEPSITVAVSGYGLTVAVPKIIVNDSIAPITDRQLPFGQLVSGGSAAQTITITNNGNAPLLLGTLTANNPLESPFSIGEDSCSGQTIEPADSCTLTVFFAPVKVGTFADSFDIPSNDPAEASVIMDVNGHGVEVAVPKIAITDSIDPITDRHLPFGQKVIGSSAAQTVTITNSGNAPLSLGTVAAKNPLANPFAIGEDSCSGQTIAPTSSCALTVNFTPTAIGTFSDAFDAPSNDPDLPSVMISVEGSGLSAATNNSPSVPQLISPANGQEGLGPDLTFSWAPSQDPDGDAVIYELYCSKDPEFFNVAPVMVSAGPHGLLIASCGVGGIILLAIGAPVGLRTRKMVSVLQVCILFIITLALFACGGGDSGGDNSSGSGNNGAPVANLLSAPIADLDPGTTYYWKVVVDDGNPGGRVESETWVFRTK